MGSSNENSAYGNVQNPAAPGCVPGGSSGGSAAAVAADLAVAASAASAAAARAVAERRAGGKTLEIWELKTENLGSLEIEIGETGQ